MTLRKLWGGAPVALLLWLWAVLLAAVLWLFAAQKPVWGVLATVPWIYWGVLLVRRYNRTDRKIQFLLDAIDNADYAFRFPSYHLSDDEQRVNRLLNRLAELLRKRREEVFENEKFYESILEATATGLLLIDERGCIHRHNRAVLRLTGLQKFTHTTQLHSIDTTFAKTLLTILPGESRQVAFHNERGEVRLSLKASQTVLKGRSLRIVSLTDIHGELAQNEVDSWLKLIRVLTHEIMNSITPITALSSDLIAKVQQADAKEGLQVIQQTASGLATFVESYRKFTNMPVPQSALFYLKPLVQRVCNLLKSDMEESNIVLKVKIEPNDLLVYADESLVAHVLTNILRNAIQAIREHRSSGVIGIEAGIDEQERVQVDISNDGSMIPNDIAEQIFVPFFTTKSSGTGVGLSVSRQIMRRLQGSLSLLSNTQTHITTFRLTFP